MDQQNAFNCHKVTDEAFRGVLPLPVVMTPQQVSDLLRCSVRTVEDHARAGTLPGVKFGDGWVFPTDALLRAINKLAEEGAAQRATPPKTRATHRRVRPTLSDLLEMGGVGLKPQKGG